MKTPRIINVFNLRDTIMRNICNVYLCLEIAKDLNAFIFFRRDCTFNVVTLILTLDNNLNPNISLSESCSSDKFVVIATTDNTDTVFAHS